MNDDEFFRVHKAAHSWLGTPFHHEARVKGVGVDCANLLIGVYSEAGLVPEIRLEHYPQDWMMHRDEERFLKIMSPYVEETDAPTPGDIILMRFGRCYSHGAIYISNGKIIHSFVNRKVVQEELSNYDRHKQRYFKVLA